MFERLRRHPLITFSILLLCAAGAALTIFLYSFDLNDYRSQLQDTLQAEFKRPVKIGALHFALRHGLSLDVSAAAIGTPQDSSYFLIDHLLLRLRIAPLLRRQLSFSSVLLDGAELHIVDKKGLPEVVADEKNSAPERINALIDLLRRTNISSLIMRNSKIIMTVEKRHYALDNIDLQLHNIAFLSPISISAAGDFSCGELRAPWQLSGQVEAAGADAPWRATRVDLTLGVKKIDLAQLAGAVGQAGPNFQPGGLAELTVRADGTPANGLNFEVRAQGKGLSLALPTLYHTPLTAQEAVVAGIWQSGTPGTIRKLTLRIDTLTLLGEAVLPSTADGRLKATLSFPETPLSRLGFLVPDRKLPRLAAALRSNEARGSAGMEKIDLHWAPGSGLHLDHARFHLHGGHFNLQGIGLVENAESIGDWQEGALTIQSAQANLLGGRSEGSGNIAFPKNSAPLFNLKISSTATVDTLIPLIPEVWQKKLHASGPISISAKLGGTPERLLLDLQSRFNEADVRFNNIPLKSSGEIGELLILGAVNSSGLELSHSLLTLPFAEARANGRLALDASGAYTLACDITNIIIEKLPPFLNVQKELQGRGEVDLRLDLNGDESGLKALQGSGEYRKLGLHLWNAVAEVRGASGRMILSREGIDFPAISGLIGLSPVRARGELKWLPAFKLTLDLDLAKTRASDLVFKSPKKFFSTISGRLVISSHEILFEKIAAEIADETRALVNGRLTYTPARLDLDIDASQGNIAGIIALWQNAEKHQPSNPPPAHHPLTAEIKAKIAVGDLYGVTFQRAAGTITLREGRLAIEPLRLDIGNGSASVAIATGPLHDPHVLLKVSGSAEKINAAQVQKQLLGHQGSITGTLDGTFALQGEIGRYLPTCNGSVNLLLNNGLLRGFASISRAMALFNVGKILTFDFPDVANDGLLFDQIKGKLTFTNGVVTSDDLTVDSPAFDMAFVGKADLAKDLLDFIMGVKPLQTVDKVLSSIPLAGWILTGEKKAFVIANFHVTGSSQDPKVEAITFSSLSDMAGGIFKRTFGLPTKIVNDVKELFQ